VKSQEPCQPEIELPWSVPFGEALQSFLTSAHWVGELSKQRWVWKL